MIFERKPGNSISELILPPVGRLLTTNYLFSHFTKQLILFYMNPVQDLIKNLADEHGRTRANLLPILQGVVEQEKYLSEFSMI